MATGNSESSELAPKHKKKDEPIEILKKILDKKLISVKPNIQDKVADINGILKLHEEKDGKIVPLGTIEVQVKVQSEKNIKKLAYSAFKVKTLDYIQTTNKPVVLIVIDPKNEIAYWEHITKKKKIPQGNKTVTVQLKKSNIITKHKKNYLEAWKKICKDTEHKVKANNYNEKLSQFRKNYNIRTSHQVKNLLEFHRFAFIDDRTCSSVKWNNNKKQFVLDDKNRIKYTVSDIINESEAFVVAIMGGMGVGKSVFSLKIIETALKQRKLGLYTELSQWPKEFDLNIQDSDESFRIISETILKSAERWLVDFSSERPEKREELKEGLQNYLKEKPSLIILEGVDEFQGEKKAILKVVEFLSKLQHHVIVTGKDYSIKGLKPTFTSEMWKPLTTFKLDLLSDPQIELFIKKLAEMLQLSTGEILSFEIMRRIKPSKNYPELTYNNPLVIQAFALSHKVEHNETKELNIFDLLQQIATLQFEWHTSRELNLKTFKFKKVADSNGYEFNLLVKDYFKIHEELAVASIQKKRNSNVSFEQAMKQVKNNKHKSLMKSIVKNNAGFVITSTNDYQIFPNRMRDFFITKSITSFLNNKNKSKLRFILNEIVNNTFRFRNLIALLPEIYFRLSNQNANEYNKQIREITENIDGYKVLKELGLSWDSLEVQSENGKFTSLSLAFSKIISLPKDIGSFHNLRVLDLDGNQLSSLPESISSLKNLQWLNLGRNQLSSLPECLSSLKNLRKLNLSWNQLSSLPESISSLKNLRELNLSWNQLSSLPESLVLLKNIRQLYLHENKLSSLPESISSLQELRELSLGNNQLSSLPESLASLKNLQKLDLHDNKLSSLPESITSLHNLRELWLSQNQLSSLPESLALLKNIRQLYLHENKLSSLPERISSLKNLRELNLSWNQLSSLPESITSLKNLRELWLSQNQLSSLPESLALLKNIRQLYLHENKLSSLPESISSLHNLRELSLSWNQLSFLPESFFLLKNLQGLSLGNNSLSSLPESISSLKNLQEFDLASNNLNSLPNSLSELSNLTELNLNNNNLTTLPSNFGQLSKIQRLFLNGNKLNSLPESFTRLLNLRELSLVGNALTSLPKNFSALSKLKDVNLSQNNLTSLPASLFALKSLEKVDVRNNKLITLPKNIEANHEIKLNGNKKTLFLSFFEVSNFKHQQLPLIKFGVENFKSLEKIKLAFDTYSCYIGNNASGKSNIVSSLRFLRDVLENGLERSISEYGGDSSILTKHNGASQIVKFSYFGFLGAETTDSKNEVMFFEEYHYNLKVNILSEFKVNVVSEVLEVKYRQGSRTHGIRYTRVNDDKIQILDRQNLEIRKVRLRSSLMLREISDLPIVYVKDLLSGMRFYDFDVKQMKKEEKLIHSDILNEDGSNLASIIQMLNRDKDESIISDFLDYVRFTLQFVNDVSSKIAERGRIDLKIKESFFPKGSMGSRDISDGTLSMIAIIVALFFQPDTKFIVFEEPERYVHPGLIRELVNLFERSTKLHEGKKQLLLTTHSPLFLKFIDRAKISHVRRNKSGATVIQKVETIEVVKKLLKINFEMHEILEDNLI